MAVAEVQRKYEQIAADLRAAIQDGTLEPESKLRSERQMMSDYGVSQGTIRKAISALQSEGLVIAVHGSGSYVAPRPPISRKASSRFLRSNREERGKAAFLAEAEDEGRAAEVEIIRIGQEVAPNRIVPLLQLRKGSKVLVRSRLYKVDGVPVETATTYIPWRLAKGTPMVEENTGPGGVYARLEESGHRLARFTEDVWSRMPNPIEVSQLELAPGVPVIELSRVAYTTDDEPVEVCETLLAANRFALRYDFPAE
ncbi:MAG: GntR family transcriptional regulator [Acidimicrobiales bacterium]